MCPQKVEIARVNDSFFFSGFQARAKFSDGIDFIRILKY